MSGRPLVSWVTWCLVVVIAVCQLLLALASFVPAFVPQQLMPVVHALQPLQSHGGPWPLLSYMLVHGSVAHLGCNLVSIVYIGSMVERLYGHGRMAALFVCSGVGGGIAFRAVHALLEDGASCVGASGAVFGLLGAYMLLLVHDSFTDNGVALRRRTARSLFVPALGVTVANVLVSMSPGIAWEAHLGGAVTGALLSAAMIWQMRARADAMRVPPADGAGR